MYNLSEVIWNYSHCAALCLQSTAQHSTGCWYTYTAKQLVLIVHIHLGVLNVGQVFSRHWNSDPTSRNPFRNFNLKCQKQRYFEHCITDSTNKYVGDILIAHIIYTSFGDTKTFAFQEYYGVRTYWHFRNVTGYGRTGISGMLRGTDVLAFHL